MKVHSQMHPLSGYHAHKCQQLPNHALNTSSYAVITVPSLIRILVKIHS